MKYNSSDVQVFMETPRGAVEVTGFTESPKILPKETGSIEVQRSHEGFDEMVEMVKRGGVLSYGDKKYLFTEYATNDQGFTGTFEEV